MMKNMMNIFGYIFLFSTFILMSCNPGRVSVRNNPYEKNDTGKKDSWTASTDTGVKDVGGDGYIIVDPPKKDSGLKDGGEQDRGSLVGIQLTMSNKYLDEEFSANLVKNSLKFVSPKPEQDNNVLVVLDDNHQGEKREDVKKIAQWVNDVPNMHADIKMESKFLYTHHPVSYDIIWFTNPGHPIDDRQTVYRLAEKMSQGVGVIVSSDDLSRSVEPMGAFLGLFNPDNNNGTNTCGMHTDNNQGEKFILSRTGIQHILLDNLQTPQFYGDDIDHAMVGDKNEVLMYATLEPQPLPDKPSGCQVVTPVIFTR